MQNHIIQEKDSEQPLDPAVERVRRKLMRLMLLSLAITILLILIVLAAVIYKIMTPTPHKSELLAPSQYMLPLKTGEKLISQSLSGSYLSLEVVNEKGKTEILIYNYQTNTLIARLSSNS
ncbi:hypothetical protein [Bartonella sp. DGB2]|uniref:hypothetical protein n=1 Tax=Bartonella sp. DGB2 TaxID=3388426 RepID=UPI00398FB99D